jgi:Pleckstrin homology domain
MKEGEDEFFFKAHGQKHTFQVKNAADRAGWLVALETKIEEAKSMKEEIHSSEGYKKHLESFSTFACPMPSCRGS